MKLSLLRAVACLGCLCAPGAAFGQGFSTASSKPRPWSRVSFYSTSSRLNTPTSESSSLDELTTAFSYQMPDLDEDGIEYGADVRYSARPDRTRPARTSIYEAFVGQRFAGGTAKVRGGYIWLNDLGSLGSFAGGMFELRQSRLLPEDGRFRAGVFGGLEPRVLETGYAPNIRKVGGYAAYDGRGAQRHALGYVMIRNGSITERSVVTTTNFLPVGQRLFVYQAAEVDLQPPSGQAHRGLTYFYATGRVLAGSRVDVQGNYNRGRSIDTRTLSEDVIAGRPISQTAVDGLLYESIGGRVTVEVYPQVRVYGGYARDKNDRDAKPSGRTLIGGYASNIAGSGVDVAASDSLIDRTTGSYHSRYFSVGRQFGRGVYASGDYSTSLSVVRYSRSDGIVVETRPHTTRFSGTATVSVGRSVSLMATVDRTSDGSYHDMRVLSGLTYRIR